MLKRLVAAAIGELDGGREHALPGQRRPALLDAWLGSVATTVISLLDKFTA